MNDEEIMLECIKYATSYAGFTKSNPKVGTAIVGADNEIILIDAHREYGGNHAEVNLLNRCDFPLDDKRLFITLEPCSTSGKTPPCVDRILSSGIKEVVISLVDPNDKNRLGGIRKLNDAGIKVKLGVAVNEGAELIEDFIKSQISEYPYTSAKVAMSIDGITATRGYDSKWITSRQSRTAVHKLRAEVDAILTGINTVYHDDPMLNCRLYESDRQPKRIILDTELTISKQSKILKSAKDIETIIFASKNNDSDRIKSIEDLGAKVILTNEEHKGMLDIKSIMKTIKEMGIINILVEAGSTLLGSLHDNDIIDRYLFYIAPIIIGGKEGKNAIGGLGFEKVELAKRFTNYSVDRSGDDILINAKQHDYTSYIIQETLNVRDELCSQG